MIGVSGRVRVFAYCEPCDMRKSYEGLAGLVRNELGQDPLRGALYLFSNRRRNRAKVLYFDGTGMCVLAKRLEKGRFIALWHHVEDKQLQLTKSELELFLQGSQLLARFQVAPSPLDEKELEVGSRV